MSPPAVHSHTTTLDLTGPAAAVDAAMLSLVQGLDAPPNLRDAIAYALLGPGKRLRPILAWYCAESVGADPRASLRAGVAVELVHAFSLVHDDLPGLDNDDLRRGRPTLHRQTSEAMAILAGDAMLNLVYLWLERSTADERLFRRLVGEIAGATAAMINGQVYDTLGGFPDALTPEQRLQLVHRNKTGALLLAACRMGALCGLAEQGLDLADQGPSLVAITQYARAVGLMFQIVDDVLDVTQTPEHIGKATGKDIDAGKITYPGVLGLERSLAEIARLEREALQAIAPLGERSRNLAELAVMMARRTR
jgi:geranylgeranyl pyrophosphate synthase